MSAPVMTFAQFIATGRDSADVAGELGFAHEDRDGTPLLMVGRVYLDALYIEREPDADENPVTEELGTFPHWDAAAEHARAIVAGGGR